MKLKNPSLTRLMLVIAIIIGFGSRPLHADSILADPPSLLRGTEKKSGNRFAVLGVVSSERKRDPRFY